MSNSTEVLDPNINPDHKDMSEGQNKNDEHNDGTGVPAAEIASDAIPVDDPRDKYFSPERNHQHPLFSGTDNNQESELRRQENKQKADALRPLV